MNNALKYLTLVLIALITSCNSNNENKETQAIQLADDYSSRIDSLIQTTEPRSFNGVILITQNGETKYSKEYGYSNFETKTAISAKDNFRIQSNSKQITAVLTLKEVEKGNIDLQIPIRKYLPDFPQSWADTVTVHQLLNMSSGIVSNDRALAFGPGTNYRYSNAAYGLLGRIIESVTANTYIELANAMFKELSMDNTFCFEFGSNPESLINGYTATENDYEAIDFYARGITAEGWKDFIPAGGIISNAHDLNLWDIHLHNGQLLSPESYELMTNYSITGQHAAFGDEKIGYGYGVRIDDKSFPTIIGHAGRGIGFASIKFYVPEKSVDVIVLENVYNEDVSIIYHFEEEIRKIVMNSNLVR